MASVLVLFHRSTLNPRLQLFVEALVTEGHEVEALCWDRGGASNADADVVPTKRIDTPGVSLSMWNILFLPYLYIIFAIEINRQRPDALLCGHISMLPLAALVGIFTHTSVVYDVVETYKEGYQSRDFPLASVFAKIVTSVEHLCLQSVAGITVIDSANDVIAERYSGYTDNFAVVYNLPRVKQAPEARDDGSTTIIYSGLVNEKKGVPKLLEAFAEVLANYDVQLVIIGDSADDTKAGLEERANNQDIADNVEFVGKVPYEDVHEHLLRGDIAVAPYQEFDTFRISRWDAQKIPDYMNAGLPVVAPDFSGFQEVVSETGCGITVDSGDVTALAEGIASLVKDQERARELGRQGRKSLEERYNWDIERKKVIEVFDRVID